MIKSKLFIHLVINHCDKEKAQNISKLGNSRANTKNINPQYKITGLWNKLARKSYKNVEKVHNNKELLY